MTSILNGIFLIIIGGTSAIFGPSVCERHGEHTLGVGVSITGIVAIALGVENIRDGMDGPDVITFPPIIEHDTVYTKYPYAIKPVIDTAQYAIINTSGIIDTVIADFIMERPDGKWHLKGIDGINYLSDIKPKKLEVK